MRFRGFPPLTTMIEEEETVAGAWSSVCGAWGEISSEKGQNIVDLDVVVKKMDGREWWRK